MIHTPVNPRSDKSNIRTHHAISDAPRRVLATVVHTITFAASCYAPNARPNATPAPVRSASPRSAKRSCEHGGSDRVMYMDPADVEP